MDWTPRLTQLNDVLGDLVPHQDGITKFIKAAGLKPSMVNFNGTALDIWNSAIDEARKNQKVDKLIEVVRAKYPDNPFLITAQNPIELNYSLSPKLEDISNWKGIEEDTLEVLTMGYSTLLPINFLARGIISSRSVAKVEKRKGAYTEVGTGFLFKIETVEELFFMTNFHVINDKEDIKKTRIIFDYEEDINGNTKASKSFNINELGPWYTSPIGQCDVTIFQLIETNEIKQFGFIPLKKIEVNKNEFVNIIQHPGGQLKQIALYHNIVTNTDNRIVQYLTDTMKGSSGSPVFNSNWEVVALHHSGGNSKVEEPQLRETKYRNEGIHINNIIDFLINNHKKQ
jgi:V8-like Glu-specific endopeptidase